jgi:prepilin-type N-terminal cleavage/methylation domain-containing protein
MFTRVNQRRRAGWTLIELMLVVTVLAILVVMAIPFFMNSKKQANETSAIASLRTICLAETEYRVRFSSYGALTDLLSGGYLDTGFSDGEKCGFRFAESGTFSTTAWAFTAEPIAPGTSGDRFFYVDMSGVIRCRDGAPATSADPAIQ